VLLAARTGKPASGGPFTMPYVRRKPLPRRPSMLDHYVVHIEAWLAAEPHVTAVAIVDQLRHCAPDIRIFLAISSYEHCSGSCSPGAASWDCEAAHRWRGKRQSRSKCLLPSRSGLQQTSMSCCNLRPG